MDSAILLLILKLVNAKMASILILVLHFIFVSVHASASTSNTIFRGLKIDPTGSQAHGSNDMGSRFSAGLDPKDPKVVELGKFVIDERNKGAKSKLSFDRVLSAVSGGSRGFLRYALVIGATSDGTESDVYYAYVVVNQDTRELVAFRKRL